MLIKKVIQNVSNHLMQTSIERWEAPFMHIKTRIYTEYYYVCKWFGKIYELIREDIRSHWKLLIPRWHWIQVFDWDTEVKMQSFIVFIRSWYLSNLKTSHYTIEKFSCVNSSHSKFGCVLWIRLKRNQESIYWTS